MLLNIKPFMQPHPKRNPGGDCFACALTAALQHLFPERTVDFNKIWECFEREQKESDGSTSKHLINYWGGMDDAITNARWHLGYSLHVYTDMVYPRYNQDQWSHAFGYTQYPEGEWSRRVEAWLAAGYVILIEMALDGIGPFTDKGLQNHTDHFALIDGQRKFWKREKHSYTDKDGVTKEFESGGEQHETHVVCSAKGAYWIKTRDLMHWHGVNAFYILRRDKNIDEDGNHLYRDYSWNESPENQAKIKD